MGVRVISDTETGESALYCSTTMWAFGPVFSDADQAEAFLDWMEPTDVRSLTDQALTARYLDFLVRLPTQNVEEEDVDDQAP